jgi:nitroimidazol reductase NimA-like FMN-containing flavoprotein (pyridoxamine 5'-phosphate oxidase superfamily)
VAEILSDSQRAFLDANHSAVMATVDDRGRPHAVPVLCALVDGQLWSSGTDLRVRTRYLTARPYASLTVLGKGFWGEWLTVSGPVETRLEEYRAAMVAERRLVYVLTPERVYPSPR